NEHYPDQERSCLGIAENKLNDFAIRSVLKKNNRFYKGEFLNCGLPAGVQLCITDANNSTGRRSWVEALLNQENYSKLSDSCQRNLNNAVRDGVISKTDEGEYVVSIYTNSQHIETIENPEVVNYLQKQTSEANSGTCENCLNSTSVFSEIMKVAEETFNITTQVRDQVQHPEGWPISADGYSYPLDPSKSYITTPRGLRRLKGYTDYHEGYDFGTFNKSLAVHAMKGGKIYKSKFKCFANSSENCNGGYGNQVVIEHDDGTKMYYSHLNANCEAKVENGQKVKVGDKIGCVGDTGRGDTHLDVRLLKRDGNAYNIVHSKFKGLYNNQTVTLRVATDFIEIESKLQSLYSHFLVKSDFKNRDSLRVALSKRWSEIDELEGKI
ncbi:MAG: M23 family metallopeptidase, partial [Bdellovibrionales bacterium]|nr:M23 family metallopeptidase [Bdellovibrionales bacterium]